MRNTCWVLVVLCTTLNLNAQQLLGPDGFYYHADGTLGENPVITGLPFLDFETNAANNGVASISVVAPESSPQNSFSQNPALPGRGLSQWDTRLDYVPWLRNISQGSPFLLDGGVIHALGKQHTAGLRIRYFDLEGNQRDAQAPYLKYQLSISGNYAYQISKKFSIGTGVKYFYSALGNVSSGFALKPASGLAFDLGGHFQTQKELNASNTLHWNVGMAITNIGSKISYVKNNDEKLDYLPAALKIGTLIAWKKLLKNDRSLDVNFSYQASKFLVPSPGSNADKNNNGITDYQEYTVPESMIHSFSDALGGSKEEWWEVTHRFGLESWMQWNDRLKTAIRGGYCYQHPYKGGLEYGTLGLTGQYRRVYLDLAYIYSIGHGAEALDGTWVVGIGCRKDL